LSIVSVHYRVAVRLPGGPLCDSELSLRVSVDLTAEVAVIDAGLLSDDAWRHLHGDASSSVTGTAAVSVDELAWNNTPSCVTTQRHVMCHRRSQHVAVTFSVDSVLAGDRAGALARRSSNEGLREMLSRLLIKAALDGDLAVVSRLVGSQFIHVDVADRTGNTALHCASVSNNYPLNPLTRTVAIWVQLYKASYARPG